MQYESSNNDSKNLNPVTGKTLLWSLAIHICLVVFFWAIMKIAFRTPESIIPIDMTIVPPWAEQTKDPEPDPNPPVQEEEKEPEKEEEVKKPDPEPEKNDVIIKEKPKPKPIDKKKAKLVKRKEPKDFKKNAKLIKNPPRMRPGKGTSVDKPMSAEEFQKYLNQNYKIGARNQLAGNELQRCVSVIAAAVRREWSKESFSWHPGLRSILVTLVFGPNGTIKKWTIVSGSGEAEVDRTVRNALSRLKRVAGLSHEFLSQYSEITVELKPVQ